MTNLVKVQILGDGNALFRSLSYLLYKTEEFHMKIRSIVTNNIKEKWTEYEPFIIGNDYYENIFNENDYYNYMSKCGVYGNEIELKSFIEIYDVRIIVYVNNLSTILYFGNEFSDIKLTLLHSNEHYDIIDYKNNKLHDMIIKKKIIGDGNCLFRTFSYFLYNNQNFHMKVRQNIVQNIKENWTVYELFIIGNEFYEAIFDKDSYYKYMSKNAIYGSEVEIQSFTDIYNINVLVLVGNSGILHSFGNKSSNNKLILFYSNEHYDIIDYTNEDIHREIKKQVNKKCYNKRKLLTNSLENITIKKFKNNEHVFETIATKNHSNKRKFADDQKSIKNLKKFKSEAQTILLETECYFGEMDYICSHCLAAYWKEEKNKFICCHNGNIVLSPLSNYDEKLKKLLFDKNFRYFIRYYNNLFCYATFSANVKQENKKAIYNLKIQGQVCHTTPDCLLPNKNEEPCCGQLYIYDNCTSVEKRFKKNESLNKEHIKIITEILNDNPYSKNYKALHQISNIQNVPDYKLYFIRKNQKQRHRYNKPLTSECGAIIVSKTDFPETYDLCVYPKSSKEGAKNVFLNKLSHHVDPMVFPLLFPCGDLGWSTNYNKRPDSKKENLSILQYYQYRLAYRPKSKIFSPLLNSGKLTQQYFLHAMIMIEHNRMNFFRQNQKKLRIECYQERNSASNNSANFENKEKLGNIFILPSTYIGSPRYYQQHYQDAMAICREIGRPDLFITFTCNPKWKELKQILKTFPPGTTPNDIPNITVRLFWAKFKKFLDDIIKNKLFGIVLSWVYTVEFQKRGLPHIHLLITLHPSSKLMTPEDIDKYISAEIPCGEDEVLQKLVIKHMLHGPHDKNSPCFDENKQFCRKNFPKNFQETTSFQKNGYPLYRRRDNIASNHSYRIKNSNKIVPVDNRMVVPYNSFLLKKYKCHINVEYCASILSIKYAYEYLHKGSDRAFCKIQKTKNSESVENSVEIKDELSTFIDGRYLSPMEAAWRLQEYPICGRSHKVERLSVHTENHQNIIFEENKELAALDKWKTTLTAWFELNKSDEFARNIKYKNIPKYYVFNSKCWVKRSRNQTHYTIGRVNVVSPKDSERFFLKLILNRITGAQSFEDLRTYKGITYNSYKEAAIAMDLVKTDSQIDELFEEASEIMLPFQLRKNFAYFLLLENINGKIIWDKFKDKFVEDFSENKENNALFHINSILESEGKLCKDFGLPQPHEIFKSNNNSLNDDDIIFSMNMYEQFFKNLNDEQKNIFQHITNNKTKMFFIDGPGGSGKTFLYKTLIYYFLSKNKKVLSMAWTGIASILLPKGMTSHRTFRLPLDLSNVESIFFKLDSDKKKLREAEVLIWDEASMIPKKALDIVDNTLRDLCNNEKPFGGKLIILGGDFRQILPVMKNGYRNIIVEDTIKRSNLWSSFKIMKLTKNMRCLDKKFSKFLLDIGEGKIDVFNIPFDWKTENVCEKIYKNINKNEDFDQVILAAHNEDVINLNKKVLNILHGEKKVYYSIDYANHKGTDQTDDNIYLDYPIEVLNNVKEGLPPYKLELKINAIIMLLRNLNIEDGLCNGTRLKIIKLYKYHIKAKIITGEKIGNIVFIPKITLNTGEHSSLPYVLYRKQFPVVLAFAMTINKSQGQSFEKVGIFINRPLFSHGQLYVALSRCKNQNKIFIQKESEDNKSEIINIVWDEVFN